MHLERSKGDLSRRAVMYTLHGLSFREFLQIQGIASWPKIALDDLLARHTELATELTAEVKPLAHLGDYWKYGYYPYFLENTEVYAQKLTETIRLILELDLPAVYGVSYATVDKIKQLLVVLAESVPFKPNVSKLSSMLQATRGSVEVGGANKSRRQIARIEEAYIAADDIEIGYGQKVPLWMFGLLY